MDISKFKYRKVANVDLGHMFMYGEKVLVVRSSQEILFFEYQRDKRAKESQWVLYHRRDTPGFISGSKRKPEFTVIEDDFIYFYELDKGTFMPKLNNVMINFLKCSMVIWGEKETYGLAYKQK